MLRRESLHPVEREEELEIHRLLGPQRAIIVEHGDTFGHRHEIRPTGSYTISPANPEPHREGGGDSDVIVLFSIRGSDGVLYELLDDDRNIIGTITMQDLVALHAAR